MGPRPIAGGDADAAPPPQKTTSAHSQKQTGGTAGGFSIGNSVSFRKLPCRASSANRHHRLCLLLLLAAASNEAALGAQQASPAAAATARSVCIRNAAALSSLSIAHAPGMNCIQRKPYQRRNERN